MVGKLKILDKNFLFEKSSHWIDYVWCWCLNFPIFGKCIFVRSEVSYVFLFDERDFSDSIVIDWELIEFSLFLFLQFSKVGINFKSDLFKFLIIFNTCHTSRNLGIKIRHKTLDLNLEGISLLSDGINFNEGYLFMLF